MKQRILLDSKQIDLAITRLCYQLIEVHNDFSNSVLIGIQPRGIHLAHRIHSKLTNILNGETKKIGKGEPEKKTRSASPLISCGNLDITFYRDDFRHKELIPSSTQVSFDIENRNVILIDDVLYSGRTVRAALDAMLALGRPRDVELVVLIDRRLSRNVPIQAKYIGKTIDSIASEKVIVEWKESEGKDSVALLVEKQEMS
ncbi:MAG: bifunctional pyr operon transcriptional regulator/uracil phosphoribosyltransferase PyrR [Bacteroidetes bacterium]|nr:bifunctional pyr operon transcriptional regulator/uracil phosphoribosyltransferase PyrR [Bacteroidota bacterium]